MKKPWDFIWAPYLNPTTLGVIGPGYLNQAGTRIQAMVGIRRKSRC